MWFDPMAAGLQLKRNGKPMALWNRDCTDYPDLNLYGSHPFLMEVRAGEQPSEPFCALGNRQELRGMPAPV